MSGQPNKKAIYATLGASNHSDGEREINDFYATDPRALELLLDLMEFDPFVWECACGKGHLSEVLKKRGYMVRSTDLIDRGYGQCGVDFLKETQPWGGDIITNPPYTYGGEFVKHALDLISDGQKVVMFLKLTFLESKSRRELFDASPPLHLCIIKSVTMCQRRGLQLPTQRTEFGNLLCLVHLGKGLAWRAYCEVV